MLHGHRAHGEAVARIAWRVAEQQIGGISGECGDARPSSLAAAVATLELTAHDRYLGTPGVGLRGIYAAIVAAPGGEFTAPW
jgi:hypothetical protein